MSKLNKTSSSTGRLAGWLISFWTVAGIQLFSSIEAKPAKAADPRRTAVFLDTTAFKIATVPPPRAVAAPAGPRIVRLQSRAAVVSPNIRIHPSSTVHQSELSIAVHPTNPDVVLAGANTVDRFLRVASQGWYRTSDGGATWRGSDTLPTHWDFTRYMADPAVAINTSGHLFFNALLIRNPSYEVVVARSLDQGTNWGLASVPSRTEGEDKNHMAIDVSSGSPFQGSIYTAYTDFDWVSSPILFSRSTSGGVKFSGPRSISGSVGSYFAQGANLAVGPTGELYAAWSGYDNFPPVTTHLGFNKSTDGGASWREAFGIRDVFDIRGMLQKGEYFVRVNSFPSMAVDCGGGPRRGWIYIVYAEKNPTAPDIFLIRSTDGGSSWSSPRKVNQDTSGRDQWFPWIAVDPLTGHLYVVYYDSRNFPANDSAQVYISSSIDGGDTFEDLLVSDAAFLPTPIPGLASGYMGDYIGITALNGVVWPAWNENRTGLHQAYTSRIVFVEIGSPPKISVSPDTLDFGEVFLEYPETLSISIRNHGFPETLWVSNLVSDNPDFISEITNLGIPGGSIRTVKIVVIPSMLGPIAAKLFITSNDTVNPTVTIALRARSVHPPFARVSPDSFSFALNAGDSITALISIVDTGLGTLSWRLFPGETLPAASPLQSLSGRMNAATGPRPPHELPGQSFDSPGKTPLLYLNPLSFDLAGRRIGMTDPHWAYGIIRGDLETIGARVTNLSFPLASGELDSLDILTIDDELARASASDIAAVRSWISAGGGLFLQGDEALTNINKVLAGTGITEYGADFSSARLAGILPHFTTSGVDTLNAQSFGAYFSTTASAQAVVLDPLLRPHAVISTLGAGRVAAVGNEVGDDANIAGGDTRFFCSRIFYWLSGFGDFLSFHPDSGSTAPQDSSVVELKVRTDRLEGGDYRARISIYSNDPARPENSIPVLIQVSGSPVIDLSPDILNFGDVFMDFPDTLTLRLSNRGSDLLEVGAVDADNPRFTILGSSSFTVFPGQTRDVRVQFLPQSAGPTNGILTVTSNDSSSPPVFVQLTGRGLYPPSLEVSHDSLEFTLPRGDSTELMLTVANAGSGPLDFKIARRAVTLPPLDSSLRIIALYMLLGPDRLLDSLRLPYSLAFSSDFETINLMDFDLLFVGATLVDSDVQTLINRKADIEAFLQAGGSVVALYEGAANAWRWLPFELGQNRNFCRDLVHIVDPVHPAMDSLSDAGLSNWTCSYRGVFTRFDPFLKPLAMGPESENRPVILAGDWGAGRLYLAATANELEMNRKEALKMLGKGIQWAAGQTNWLSVSPAGGTLSPGGHADLRVKIKTEGLASGSYRANILVSSNDPAGPLDTIPVEVLVSSCAAVGGDLNGNKLLTIYDVILQINCVFFNEGNGTVGNDCNLCYADGNCDGVLSAADLILLLQAVFFNRPFAC